MKIIVCKDSKEGGLKAAEILRDVINEKNDAVLGLATGSTPIATAARYSAKLIKINDNTVGVKFTKL